MLLVYKSSQFFVGIPSNQMWQSKSSINEGSNRKIMELNGGFPVAVSAEGKPTCPFIVHSFFIHCSFIFHSLFIHFSLYHHCTTTILGEIPIQHHPKPILKPSVTPPEAADAVQSAQSALAMEENGDNGHRPKEKEHKVAAAPAWWIFRGKRWEKWHFTGQNGDVL